MTISIADGLDETTEAEAADRLVEALARSIGFPFERTALRAFVVHDPGKF